MRKGDGGDVFFFFSSEIKHKNCSFFAYLGLFDS